MHSLSNYIVFLLGHLLDIHKMHYDIRCQISARHVLECVQVIQDNNLVGKFHGKKLKGDFLLIYFACNC